VSQPPDVSISHVRERIVKEYVDSRPLTPSEKEEVHRIARGLNAKESSAEAHLSDETIRARRKRLYKKLGVNSHDEVMVAILEATIARFLKVD